MQYKSVELAAELDGASVFLHAIAEAFDAISKLHCGQDAIVTRVKEHICGSSGVHEDCRGVDFRDEFEGGRLYADDQVKFLVDYMNKLYPRNDGKVTCIHHSFDGGPLHFHLQLATLTKTYEAIKPSLEPAV